MNRNFFLAQGLSILNLLILTVVISLLSPVHFFASGKAEEAKKTYRIPEIEDKSR
jgi:hypothetical protein